MYDATGRDEGVAYAVSALGRRTGSPATSESPTVSVRPLELLAAATAASVVAYSFATSIYLSFSNSDLSNKKAGGNRRAAMSIERTQKLSKRQNQKLSNDVLPWDIPEFKTGISIQAQIKRLMAGLPELYDVEDAQELLSRLRQCDFI